MLVPDFAFEAGDLLAVHGSGMLARTIQRYQRRRFGATLGAQVNHIAVVTRPGRGLIVEGYWPRVRWLTFAQWFGAWVNEARGEWALCLRPAELNAAQGSQIGLTAEGFVDLPYDVRTLLRLGRIYRWWHPCRWWAEMLITRYRRDAGSLTCSELGARASAVVMDLPWDHLDLVCPAQIVDAGRNTPLWEFVWRSS